MTITFSLTKKNILENQIQTLLHQEFLTLTGNSLAPNSYQFNALYEGKFIGGIIVEWFGRGDILWIESCAVEPAFRHQGIGKKLFAQLIEFAKNNNIQQLQLNTYLPQAHQFWLAQGFEIVTTIAHWKYGLSCYLMRKYL